MRTPSGFSLGRGRRGSTVALERVFVLGFLLVKKGEADVFEIPHPPPF